MLYIMIRINILCIVWYYNIIIIYNLTYYLSWINGGLGQCVTYFPILIYIVKLVRTANTLLNNGRRIVGCYPCVLVAFWYLAGSERPIKIIMLGYVHQDGGAVLQWVVLRSPNCEVSGSSLTLGTNYWLGLAYLTIY